MAKIVVTNNGLVQQELSIVKPRTNLGRRPNNDLVLEQLTVSGQHAAIDISGKDVFLIDVGSTNGTLVNGQKITKHLLQHQDVIEIGTYKIKFLSEPSAVASDPLLAKPNENKPSSEIQAKIKVLSGSNSGREMTLNKPVTMLGSAGILVVSISRENQQYFIKHVDGKNSPDSMKNHYRLLSS